MNFKSYNLFMAVVVSLRELVDELKIITDEHIGEITAVKEGSNLPEMTVAMIEEFLDVP